jgi:hypothetical protein
MGALQTLTTVLPLSLTSGINLYATVLIVGLSIRFGWVDNVPSGLDALGSWPVIVVAGVLYVIEFLVDKFQFVDNLWDLAHTFIRPVGAAMVGTAAIGQASPVVTAVGALVAGGVALASHSSKAGSRMTLNVVSPAENISNIGVSVAEDAGVGVLAFLALKHPLVATAIALVILVLIIIFLPRLMRWTWFTLRSIFARLKGFVRKVSQSDTLPTAHLALLGHQKPDLAARCSGQSIKGANGRTGYVSVIGETLHFTFDRLFGNRAWSLPLADVVAAYFRHRTLMDVIEIHYQDARQKSRVARFVFMKDRGPLAEQLADRLARSAQVIA